MYLKRSRTIWFLTKRVIESLLEHCTLVLGHGAFTCFHLSLSLCHAQIHTQNINITPICVKEVIWALQTPSFCFHRGACLILIHPAKPLRWVQIHTKVTLSLKWLLSLVLFHFFSLVHTIYDGPQRAVIQMCYHQNLVQFFSSIFRLN